jgi:hypothetical protein
MVRSSLEFLQKWSPSGPWILTCVDVNKKGIETRTFKVGEEEQLTKWVDYHNGTRNLYFHVNPVLRELTTKAKKEEIKAGNWLHVDIDPLPDTDLVLERERILSLLKQKLPKGIPTPTVIIASGGGYQAFWRLREPVEIDGDLLKAEEFERYNRHLEMVFGGDHCHNVDRIMRLPWTMNIPDKRKIEAGRKETKALCFEFNTHAYSLDNFKKAGKVQIGTGLSDNPQYSVKISGNIKRVDDLDDLDIPNSLKVIIAQGSDPDKIKEGDNSRSAWLFDCVCNLIRNNIHDDIIYSLITDPAWGISHSVVGSKSPHDYAIRQISRAKQNVQDPILERLNANHAVITNIAGKCRIIEELRDYSSDEESRSILTFSTFEDFRNRYSNEFVGIWIDGKPKSISIGKYWLAHKNRRQYLSIEFMPKGDKPDIYNLWQGFTVQPKAGDCSLFLDHILENVCSGNDKHYEYLINWLARVIQYPATQGEVAVVLKGDKGVGKSIVPRIFGKLLGRHYLHIANSEHLVGKFNAHLRDVVCLFADEAFFAGDKKNEPVLKMLITESRIPIEQKGIDAISSPNYIHLIMASNEDHVIRATGKERRYFVLQVSQAKQQDMHYFGDIFKQMEKEGGLQALLDHLQNIDLKDFDVRAVPQTSALKDQKSQSLTPIEDWWYQKLKEGWILENNKEWKHMVVSSDLVMDYIKYANKWQVARRGNETIMAAFIKRYVPHSVKKQITLKENEVTGQPKTRAYVTHLGTLQQCRKAWIVIQGETAWDLGLQGEF